MNPPHTSLDAMQWALLAAAFLAAALGLEGMVLLWHQTRSTTVQRLRRRLQAWFPETTERTPLELETAYDDASTPELLREAAPSTVWGRLQERLQGWMNRRASRVRAVVLQLPDALDLMARALRSGHAFSTALQMVAEEGPQPLAGEFALVVEQLTLGGDPDEAFDALAERVPVDEMRFFAMAVKLQRQTGGQLAEVLGNIAHLLRQRLRLLDKVRVLTAEGRLSAQVLAALPPVTGAALLAARPEFISVLWTDPAGMQLLQISAALMVLGGVWLWRLTRIRV